MGETPDMVVPRILALKQIDSSKPVYIVLHSKLKSMKAIVKLYLKKAKSRLGM